MKKSSSTALLNLALLICGPVIPFLCSAEPVVPAGGFVPDKQTAIKIAEAVLVPVYGESVLKSEPFNVAIEGEKWIVKGTLPKGRIGGVPTVEISKTNGAILRMVHSK